MPSKADTRPPHRRFVFQKNAEAGIAMTWAVPEPGVEAQALFQMFTHGHSDLESLRELIDVSEEAERRLRAFIAAFPELTKPIERVLTFRSQVRTEFEKLVRASTPGAAGIVSQQNSLYQNRLSVLQGLGLVMSAADF